MKDSAHRIAIKALAVVILGLLVWPLPQMVAFCNPEEGTILGCFTPTFFLMLVAYGLVVLAWAAVTLWTVVRLDRQGLDTLRSLIRRRPVLFVMGFAAAVLVAAGIRAAITQGIVVLPAAFAGDLALLPPIAAVLLCGVARLVLDDETLEAIEEAIKRGLGPLAGGRTEVRHFGRVLDWQQTAVGVTLGLMMVLLLGESVSRQYWDQPIINDGSIHLYIGQNWLHGGVPYITMIYSFSPLRFLISALWGLGARLSGLPLVTFVRGLDLVVGCAVLALVYGIGLRLTGRQIGGLMAAALMVGTEQIQDLIYFDGPNIRLTAVLVMLPAVWFSQNRRWFWAGVAAAMAGLMWPPAVVIIGAVGIGAVFSSQDRAGWFNRQAVLATGAGVLTPLLITIVGSLIVGNLKEMYQQNVVTMWVWLIEKVSQGQGGPRNPILSVWDIGLFLRSRELVMNLHAAPVLELLIGVGWVLSPFVDGLRNLLKEPERSVPLLASILTAGVVLYDYRGAVTDSIMLVSNLAAFGALAALWVFASPGGWQRASFTWLRGLLGSLVLVVVILVVWRTGASNIQRRIESVTGSLAEQTEMAQSVNSLLAPDDAVLSFNSAWFLVLTDRNNAVAPRYTAEKLPVLDVAGWSTEHYMRAAHAARPALILVDDSIRHIPFEPDWLDAEYVDMGGKPAYRTEVYVRADRTDLMDVIAGWDLQPPKLAGQ